jgi:pyruvate-formate lyase-activating enzyme
MSNEKEIPEMPFLRNVGLLMTYKCQVACPHCIIEAGPNRKEEVQVDDVLGWIRQIASYRDRYIKVLSLTGGEPFFNIASLKAISDYGAAQGLIVSAVTNAFWAHSANSAVRTLRDLPAIRMLAISCDTYHQTSIPFERVKNAIHAARKCEIPYNIAICTQNADDPGYRALLQRLHDITDPDTINTAVTLPVGRALQSLPADKYRMSSEAARSACSAGSSPIIFPNGRILACIGPIIDLKSDHPLVLGDLRKETLESILDRADMNAVLHAIRVWGPQKLIMQIKEQGLGGLLPGKYIDGSVCDACYSLMSKTDIVKFLDDLNRDDAFVEKVAYARSYYLKEVPKGWA